MEIERKFLIDEKKFIELEIGKLPETLYICQIYLLSNPTIRLRICLKDGKKSYDLTFKSHEVFKREEVIVRLSEEDCSTIKRLFKNKELLFLSKVRYRIEIKDGYIIEVDNFVHKIGHHEWLAEIELKDEKCSLPILPEWIKEEVTDNEEYYNINIAKRFSKLDYREIV